MAKTEKPDVEKLTLEFLYEKHSWPLFTVLPVKRKREGQNWPQFGMVPFFDTKKVILALVGDSAEKIANAEVLEYPTLEAIVADGWRVD